MEAVKLVEQALKQYQNQLAASKRYYDKKMGPVELRRPRGRVKGSKNRPKVEGGGVGTDSTNPEGVAEGCVQTI